MGTASRKSDKGDASLLCVLGMSKSNPHYEVYGAIYECELAST